MDELLVAVTVVVVGLMVGVELAVAAVLNPIFDRLPGDGGVAARGDGARILGRVMPFWYVVSVGLAVGWAALAWGRPGGASVLAAGVLLVLSVAMSLTLLVPINKRVARWSAGEAPADWRRQVGRWDRWHYVRVGVLVGAFGLLVVATLG